MKQYFTLVILLCLLNFSHCWDEVTTSGTPPPNRGGGVMEQIGEELILFGGINDCFNSSECSNIFYNDVYHFNLNTNTWSKPTVIADPTYGVPEERVFLGSTVYSTEDDDEVLVIYGGTSYPVDFTNFTQWNQETVTYDDLWFYYPLTYTWERIIYGNSTENPGPLSGAQLHRKGDRLYVVGGVNSNTFVSYENTWKLKLDDPSDGFSLVAGSFQDSVNGTAEVGFPVGRYIFPFVSQKPDQNHVYAFSGNIIPIPPLLGVQYQDLWLFHTAHQNWTKISPGSGIGSNFTDVNSAFTGRVHGGAAVIRKSADRWFIQFFGDDNDDANECVVDSISAGQSPVNETWAYKLPSAPFVETNNGEWLKLSFATEPTLKRVYFTNTDHSGKAIYVYGGFDSSCTGGGNQGTTVIEWNTKMYKLRHADIRTAINAAL